MFWLRIPAAILVISLLVIIHEFGHYIVARAFGMRVVTFSVGFGPPLVRFRPKGSDTVFQIALIPVLAYVQIAGMSPREVADPADRGSYQNARPIARFLTIAAGPLANYLAASLLMFVVVAFGGQQVGASVAGVQPGSPAQSAGLQRDDAIRTVNGAAAPDASAVIQIIRASQGHPIVVAVDRAGRHVDATVSPRFNATEHRFMIGVEIKPAYGPAPLSTAVELAVVAPARMTVELAHVIWGMIRGRVAVQPMGVVGMVAETQQQMQLGWRDAMGWIAMISLQLFFFNLMPIPALDGGRLVVLGYEMTTGRRPNPRIEARVLAASLMLLISVFVVVNVHEIWVKVVGLFHA